MALKINDIHSMNGIGLHENGQIVGTIDNLQDKLDGKLPIDRLELIELVNSWGRIQTFVTYNNNVEIKIEKCEAKECYDLSKLDVSQITNMDSVFKCNNYNGDISNWNTSNVTSMERMFYDAYKFNQPLNFDTSKVTNMSWMFFSTYKFNQPLKFDTSNVTDMNSMFNAAFSFNQEIKFDTSKVTNMNYMFYEALIFNQPLNFDTSKVVSMNNMFDCAREFNQPLNFDISNVTNMKEMFYDAKAFQNKYNSGEPLPKDTESIKAWLNNHREKTNEIKADTINSKLDNNKNEFEQLIKEKNIPIDSKLYKELLSVYNQTQDKLKNDLDELKSKVVDIATKDFANIHL